MADDAEVKLGADVSDLKSDTADGASSVDASLKKIQASLDGLSSKSKKTSDDVKAHTDGMAAAFAALHENIRVRFGSINNVFEQFSSKLAIFGAAFAGGALFKGAVSSLLELEESVRGLVITFGMTTEKATQTAVALKLAGISAETYEQMGQRVGRVLRTQSDEFDRLGVKTKDANGDLLPMDQILQNVYRRMQDFKAGTDQTEFALSTVGRNAKDFASDMERLTSSTDRAAIVMARLGIEMGPDRIRQVEEYRRNINEFKLTLDAIGEKIGEAVLPRLDGMAVWFNDIGPSAIVIIVGAVKVFLSVLTALGTLVASVAIYAGSSFDNMATRIKAASDILKVNILDAWTEVPKIIAAADAKIEATNKAAAESVAASWAGAYAKIDALWSNGASKFGMGDRGVGQSGGLPGSGSERFKPKPTGSTGDPIAEWENILKASENAYNHMQLDQGSFKTWSIEMTRDYWAQVVGMTAAGSKEQLEARNKFYDADRQVQQAAFAAYIANLEAQKAALGHNIEAKIGIEQQEYDAIAQKYGATSAQAEISNKRLIDLRQQLADQRLKIADIEAKAEDATAKHSIEMAKLSADQQLALREINAQQRFAIEQNELDKEYAALVADLQRRIALMASDPTSDPVKLAELNAQLLKARQDYETKATQISNQAELDRKQVALQAAQDVENAFGTFIDDLISRNKTLKQSFQDLVKSITSDLNKLASQEIAKSLFGPGTGGNNLLAGLFGKIFGGGAGDATLQATHTEALAADTTATATLTTSLLAANTALAAFTASLAASGAGAGITAIGGSIFGEGGAGVGFGFSDALASFDVGTPYVPQDTLAIVHKGEAIIPAAMNRGGAVSTGPMHMHFYISGNPDSRTLDQIQAAAARGASKSSRSVM
jgi:hypothetical protein